MPASPLAVRTLTVLAAAFLAFDGVALVAVGVWLEQAAPAVVGVVLVLASLVVLLLSRRQQRRLEEIAAARRELREEAESLRRLLGR